MWRLIVVLLFLLSSLYASERIDITLTDGTVLSKAKVLSHSPKDVVVLHSGGTVENISWDKMPDEFKKAFKYDPKKAQEYDLASERKELANEQREKQLKELRELIARSRYVVVTVEQKLNGGALVDGYICSKPYTKTKVRNVEGTRGYGLNPDQKITRRIEEKYKDRDIYSIGVNRDDWAYIQTDLVSYDGERMSLLVYDSGAFEYANTLGAGKAVKGYVDAVDHIATLVSKGMFNALSGEEIAGLIEQELKSYSLD